MKYVCDICGYVYDPELGDPDNGVAPGTPWEEVPEDWVCPLCGVGKDQFFSALCRYRHTAILFFKPKLLCNLPICMVQQMCGKLYDTTNRKESFL